jgi:hypothetical protein
VVRELPLALYEVIVVLESDVEVHRMFVMSGVLHDAVRWISPSVTRSTAWTALNLRNRAQGAPHMNDRDIEGECLSSNSTEARDVARGPTGPHTL